MNKMHSPIAIIFTLFLQINLIQAQNQCHIDDWTALKAFYESTNGDNWDNRTGWDVEIANRDNPTSNCNLNTLNGVSTALDRVNKLQLISNNLVGSIPGEIEKLKNLQYLTLTDNELNGTIPTAIGNLTQLKDLILKNNNLIGSLPNEIGNLNNLTQLYINKNQLSGEIPASLGNLSKVQFLGFDENQLTGNIPSEIGNLSRLKELWLQVNNLSGEIPAEIGDLNNLNILSISLNKLHGCFPASLATFCSQITDTRFDGHNNIDYNNIFDARWDDFCANGSGSCESTVTNTIVVPTNYSGNVDIETSTANILRNNYATVYNHCISNCEDSIIIKKCGRVNGFNNLSANEALWATSKAGTFIAPYFATYHDKVLSPINIIVDYTCDLHKAAFRPTNNTILLGKGDGTERNSMAALDIVSHEYAHYIINSIENLNFINFGIPGAISESFADIFGEVIEHYTYGENDWIFGGQINTAASPYKGIRSFCKPKSNQMKYQLPNTYKGAYWIDTEEDECLNQDFCGRHTNSGVHNYWFYLLAKGGNGINDNGDAYNINGIGIEKAFDIVFENFSTHLQAGVSYTDVMLGSIQSAINLHGDASNEAATVIDAWRAVGLDFREQNPIQFSIVNARRFGDVMVQPNGAIDIPVQFDLTIDSLGQDLSADNLCFTLHLPKGYQGFKIIQVYEPLTNQELEIVSDSGEMNICIDRLNTGAQKTTIAYEAIRSGKPILSVIGCIEVIDVGGEESFIDPINISGYTKLGSNKVASFKSENLLFGLDTEILESGGDMNCIVNISHENCNTLGAVEIEAIGNPPFTFGLKNVLNNSFTGSHTINDTRYQFSNLESGDYEIEVFDNASHRFIEEFSIEFVANVEGSFCCPDNLIVSTGISNNFYNATDTISLSIGTLIVEGALEICD